MTAAQRRAPSAKNQRLRFDTEFNGYTELVIDKKGRVVKEADTVHLLVIQDCFDRSVSVYKGDSLLEGTRRLWAAQEIVAHNGIQADVPILERVTGLKKPKSCRVDDTLIRLRVKYPEHNSSPAGGNSLGEWGIYLKCHKGDFKGPWDRWSQEMEDYCIQDVIVLEQIDLWLQRQPQNEMVVAIEHRCTEIDARRAANGWGFDLAGGDKLMAQLEIERAGIMDELNKVFPPKIETLKTPAYWVAYDQLGNEVGREPTKGKLEKRFKGKSRIIQPGPLRTKEHPFNPDSGDQIAERLIERYGWKPTEMTDSEDNPKPKTDYDVLVKLPYPEAKLLLRAADNSKLLEALKDYTTRASKSRDGRIHGSINVQGAVTGRKTHSQPNTGNVPKDPRVRGLFRARKGWKVVGGDAQGLELRMLANRMARYDGGRYGRILLEGDIHTENMNILRLVVVEIDRDGAKTFIYAFLYGAGDGKIGKIVKRGPDVGKALKAMFLKKLPAMQKLIDWCQSQAKHKGVLVLLDTRTVPCRAAYAALNTQLQGDGAVVMKVAMLALDKALQDRGYVPGQDYEFMGDIHDEFQLESRPEIAEEVGKLIVWSIEEAGRRLRCKIALAGSYKVGDSWAETH